MKVNLPFSVAFVSRQFNVLVRIGLPAFAVTLVSCHNYTQRPLCNEANATNPEGMTGVYTISIQDQETFDVKTTQIEILSEDKTLVRKNLETHELQKSRICHINGKYIEESYDEDAEAYSQSQLFVTAMGLTSQPLMFNAKDLAAAGIAYKVFLLPNSARNLLGEKASSFLENLFENIVISNQNGILILNEDHDPRRVIDAAYAAPVGVTLLRR